MESRDYGITFKLGMTDARRGLSFSSYILVVEKKISEFLVSTRIIPSFPNSVKSAKLTQNFFSCPYNVVRQLILVNLPDQKLTLHHDFRFFPTINRQWMILFETMNLNAFSSSQKISSLIIRNYELDFFLFLRKIVAELIEAYEFDSLLP